MMAATSSERDGTPPRRIADDIEAALPSGSTVESCFGARLRERLAAGDVDLVVYPFDESFPVDTFDEVRAFVNAGGVLAAMELVGTDSANAMPLLGYVASGEDRRD